MPDAAPVLAGVRVLDVGRYIAGPFCAALLAQLGADVIRVEPPSGGDDRHIAPLGPGREGALFVQANHGKRAIAIDIFSPGGRDVLRRLVSTADVVVANLPPATLAAAGLDYDSLRAIRPDIILTAISGFGPDGPDRNVVAFDGVIQAMSGAMYLSGVPGAPVKAYVPYVDYGTALAAAFGTLAALLQRQRTGRGQQVDASLIATGLTFAGSVLAEQAVLSRERVGTGNRGQLYGPSDTFATRDGFLLVQVLGRSMFERWARLLGEERWLRDSRFATDQDRGNRAAELSARMARWCAERTTEEALGALRAARIAAGPVLTPQACLDHPQVAAARVLQNVRIPGVVAAVPIAPLPVRLSEGGSTAARRAPLAGEHTTEILDELGLAAPNARAAEIRP